MIIEAVNESTCIVYFGDRISDDIAGHVKWATEAIRQSLSDLVIDLVPSYTSVLVCYDADRTDRFGIASRLRKALSEGEQEAPDESASSTIELPVYYGDEVGLDLDEVCDYSGLSRDEVVRIHSEQTYRVYAIGFSPGFAYLGITDQRIALLPQSHALTENTHRERWHCRLADRHLSQRHAGRVADSRSHTSKNDRLGQRFPGAGISRG